MESAGYDPLREDSTFRTTKPVWVGDEGKERKRDGVSTQQQTLNPKPWLVL
jgi:hypothetical protein